MTAGPDTTGVGGQPRAPGRHGHLWSLPDGTGLHAPPGRLVTEVGTGRLCCHLCGQWFTALGVHVRVHGHTVGTYRQAMGLPRSSVLVAARSPRRGGGAGGPQAAAPAAGPGRAGRRAGGAERRDTQQRAGGRGAAPQGGADDPCPALRQDRSEGWTIIVTAAAGGQGSVWARWLLRQAGAR